MVHGVLMLPILFPSCTTTVALLQLVLLARLKTWPNVAGVSTLLSVLLTSLVVARCQLVVAPLPCGKRAPVLQQAQFLQL